VQLADHPNRLRIDLVNRDVALPRDLEEVTHVIVRDALRDPPTITLSMIVRLVTSIAWNVVYSAGRSA
jgi:hypothetical protein